MHVILGRVAGGKVGNCSPSTSSFSFLGDRVRSGAMFREVAGEGRCREEGMGGMPYFGGYGSRMIMAALEDFIDNCSPRS